MPGLKFNPASARRRGVVLIFTVAVLVLLAIIATAFLATARIDRVYLDQKSGAILQGSAFGGEGGSELPGAVLTELRRDLFDTTGDPGLFPVTNAPWPNPSWAYRPSAIAAVNTYSNWDYLMENPTDGAIIDGNASYVERQRYDPYLASRAPEPMDASGVFSDVGGAGYFPAWRVISRWPELWDDAHWTFGDDSGGNPGRKGFFESPYGTGTIAAPQADAPRQYTQRWGVVPTYIRVTYPVNYATPRDFDGKTLVFPALLVGNDVFLAGDADGDGVADSGLFPLNHVYDGSLPFDVTKLKFPDTTIDPGYFPGDTQTHNIRSYAAIRVVDNGGGINVNTAWRRNGDIALTPMAFTEAAASPANFPNYGFFRSNIGLLELLKDTSSDAARQWEKFQQHRTAQSVNNVTGRNDYLFSTLAELIENGSGRTPFTSKGYEKLLAGRLAYHNGMIDPESPQSGLESDLFRDLYINVPNWSATSANDTVNKSDPDRSFRFFAAAENQPLTPPTNASTVFGAPNTFLPMYWWHASYNPGGDRASVITYGTPAPPARPIRHLVTTNNGVSTSVRPDPTYAVPANSSLPPFNAAAKPKGAINTDNARDLWPRFFLTMTDGANPVSNEIDTSTNGGPTGTTMALIRSAMATVNTLDMRDGDDNLSTMQITAGGQIYRVAGCERQLVIESAELAGSAFRVTVRNPYDPGDPSSAINGDAYYIALSADENGPTTVGPYDSVVQVGGSIAGGAQKVVNVSFPVTKLSGDIVLIRTRKADGRREKGTDELGSTYDETGATYNELVCVDKVNTGTYTSITTSYQRDLIDWKLASCGDTFAASGTTRNPINLPNIPANFGLTRAQLGGISAAANRFPYGTFARNGDMMLIPYTGHYAVYSGGLPGRVVPMTEDVQTAAFVDAGEKLPGRFIPDRNFQRIPASSPPGAKDWRLRLFENFTAQANPMSDRTPNVAIESWLKNQANPAAPSAIGSNDPDFGESTAPVQGLVNVNTASREVLRMVPFVTDTNGLVDPTQNDVVVDAILADRRANGPFASVFDLLRIPAFQAGSGGSPNGLQGQFLTTPLADFGNAYHSFIRVSNLLTTRSDTFTVYVLLQEWQDFGTRTPVLRSESRYAAIVDRSQLRETQRAIKDIQEQSFATD